MKFISNNINSNYIYLGKYHFWLVTILKTFFLPFFTAEFLKNHQKRVKNEETQFIVYRPPFIADKR